MITRFKLFELTATEINQVELGDRLKVIDPLKNSNKGIGDFINCIVIGYPFELRMAAKDDPTNEIIIWCVDVVDSATKEEAVAFFHPVEKVWVIKQWKNPFMLQRNSFQYNEEHTERYYMHYDDAGCIGSKYGNDLEKLKQFGLSNPNIKSWEIYRNSPHFHDNTQEEYLVCWFDEGGRDYWSNRAKKEPEISKKRIPDPPRLIAKRFDL